MTLERPFSCLKKAVFCKLFVADQVVDFNCILLL